MSGVRVDRPQFGPPKRPVGPEGPCQPEPGMSLPPSVSEILSRHVTLEVEGIDRMYLNVYVPRLQSERGVASFFRFHRGHAFASSALMEPISKAFIAKTERFVQEHSFGLRSSLFHTRVYSRILRPALSLVTPQAR